MGQEATYLDLEAEGFRTLIETEENCSQMEITTNLWSKDKEYIHYNIASDSKAYLVNLALSYSFNC